MTTPQPAAMITAADLSDTPLLGVTSTVELTIRMIVALAVILSVMALMTRYGRRYLNQRTTTGPKIVVEHQHQLTKHTNLTLLTAGTTHLLIATNNQTTTLLAQGPQLTTQPTNPTPQTTTTPPTTTTNPNIDIRTKHNPLKTLQNKTVRR